MTKEQKKDINLELLIRWIRLGQEGITLEKLLCDRNMKRIAVYGYNKIAKCIIYELRSGLVHVCAILDRRAGDMESMDVAYPVYLPEEAGMMDLDAIILLPVDDYIKLSSSLRQYTGVQIVSLEDLLYEL